MQKLGSSAQGQLRAAGFQLTPLKHERRGGNLLLPILESAYKENLNPDFQ